MEFGFIYIEWRIMICLHTFEDDISVWKELLRYCGSPELISLRLIIKVFKASDAIDVVKQFS